MHFKLLLFLIFLGHSLNSIDKSLFVENPRIFFFDIGQTLIEVDSLKASTRHLGLKDLITNTFRFLFKGEFEINKATANQYLELLNKIPSPFKSPNYDVIGYNGMPMPPLQRDSQLGRISLKKCLQIINKWIKNNPQEFKNRTEKRIFRKLCNLNFNPEIFVTYQKYTKTINLLRKLYCQLDGSNKRKNICFIFSNQPKEVVEKLKIYFPDIFKFSDIQIFSCFEGLIKIHPFVYQKYLSMCPENSQNLVYLIDDEINNLTKASEINYKDFRIFGVHPKEIKKLKELIQMN